MHLYSVHVTHPGNLKPQAEHCATVRRDDSPPSTARSSTVKAVSLDRAELLLIIAAWEMLRSSADNVFVSTKKPGTHQSQRFSEVHSMQFSPR